MIKSISTLRYDYAFDNGGVIVDSINVIFNSEDKFYTTTPKYKIMADTEEEAYNYLKRFNPTTHDELVESITLHNRKQILESL